MRPIPAAIRKIIATNPYYRVCARAAEGECDGIITIEHAYIYAGKQINEIWALLPLCWYHHLGDGLIKWLNQYLALERATDEDLAKYPKNDWKQLRHYLRKKYEEYKRTQL